MPTNRASRAYAHPLPPADTAARILRALGTRALHGQPWTVEAFTDHPDTIALVHARLATLTALLDVPDEAGPRRKEPAC
jgi:hypothetical protein